MSTRGKNKDDTEDNVVWTPRDCLTLASIVQRIGDRNWVVAARSMKQHGENAKDWYTPKKCAAQYNKLFKIFDDNKKTPKRNEKDRRFLEDLLVKNLYDQRMQELQNLQNECESLHRCFDQVEDLIDDGWFDDNDDLECLNGEIEKFGDAWEERSSTICSWDLTMLSSPSKKMATSTSVTKGKSPSLSPEAIPSTSTAVMEQDISIDIIISEPEIEEVTATKPPVSIPSVSTPSASILSVSTAFVNTPSVSTLSVSTSSASAPSASTSSANLKSSSPPQSFFSPNSALASAAARQFAAATSPAPTTIRKLPAATSSFRASVSKTPLSSVTKSAPTLSKLLEMPPSIPGKLPLLPTALYSPIRSQTEKDTKALGKEEDSWQSLLSTGSKQQNVQEIIVERQNPSAVNLADISDNACVLPDNNPQTKLIEYKTSAVIIDDNSSNGLSSDCYSSSSEDEHNGDYKITDLIVIEAMRAQGLSPLPVKCDISENPDDSGKLCEHTDNKPLLEKVPITASADASLNFDKENSTAEKTFPISISTVEDITEDTVLNEVGGSTLNVTGRTTFGSGSATFSSVGCTTFGPVASTFGAADTKAVAKEEDSWQSILSTGSKPQNVERIIVERQNPSAVKLADISDNACVLPDNNPQTKLIEYKRPTVIINNNSDSNGLSSDCYSSSSEDEHNGDYKITDLIVIEAMKAQGLSPLPVKCDISESPDDSGKLCEHTDNKPLLEEVPIPDSITSSADASLNFDKENSTAEKTFPISISAVEDITEDTVLNEVGGSTLNVTGSTTFGSESATFSSVGCTTFGPVVSTFGAVGSTTFGTVSRTSFGTVGNSFGSVTGNSFSSIGNAAFSTVANTFGSVGSTPFSSTGTTTFNTVGNTFSFEPNDDFHSIAAKSKLLESEHPLSSLDKNVSKGDCKSFTMTESLLKLRELADDSDDKSLQGSSSSSNNTIISPKDFESDKYTQFSGIEMSLMSKKKTFNKDDKSNDDPHMSSKKPIDCAISLQDIQSCLKSSKSSSSGLILDSLKQFAVASGVGDDSDKLSSSGTSSSDHSSSETLSISSSSQDSDTKNDEKCPVLQRSKTLGSPKKGRVTGQGFLSSATKTRNTSRGSQSSCKSRGTSSPRKFRTFTPKGSGVDKGYSSQKDQLFISKSPRSSNYDISSIDVSDVNSSDSPSKNVPFESDSVKGKNLDTIVRPFCKINSPMKDSADDLKTCISDDSRNREVGDEVGHDQSLEQCEGPSERLIHQRSQKTNVPSPKKNVKKQILSRRGRRGGRITPKGLDTVNEHRTMSGLVFTRNVEVALQSLSEADTIFFQQKMNEAQRDKQNEKELSVLETQTRICQRSSRAARRGRRGRGRSHDKVEKDSTTADDERKENEDSADDSDIEDITPFKVIADELLEIKSKSKESDENVYPKSINRSILGLNWNDGDNNDKNDIFNFTEKLKKIDGKVSGDSSSSSSPCISSPASSNSTTSSSPCSSPGSTPFEHKDMYGGCQWGILPQESKDLEKQHLEAVTKWHAASTSISDSSDESTDDSDESLPATNPNEMTSEKSSPKIKRLKKDHDAQHQYKRWKRSICMIWREASYHKYANVFSQKVTDDVAPGYTSIVNRPMDLSLIKRNIDNGTITTTEQFQRDMMLMFLNAIMYNSSDHDVYHMAVEMQRDVYKLIQDYLATQVIVEEKVEPPPVQPSLRAGRRINKRQRSSASKSSNE